MNAYYITYILWYLYGAAISIMFSMFVSLIVYETKHFNRKYS